MYITQLLTVFGERDENVDCMNRIKDPLAPPKRRGLDGLVVEWNHDEFGYRKLRRYLPARVNDVMRYHSLRELKFIVDPKFVPPPQMLTEVDRDLNVEVPQHEIRALTSRMDATDRARAKFVAHFAYFDSAVRTIGRRVGITGRAAPLALLLLVPSPSPP